MKAKQYAGLTSNDLDIIFTNRALRNITGPHRIDHERDIKIMEGADFWIKEAPPAVWHHALATIGL